MTHRNTLRALPALSVALATALAGGAVAAPPPWANNGGGGRGLPAPITEGDFPSHSDHKVALGKALFWDKLLSGNENIACATCHHSQAGTGDNLSLPVGEGGAGLGVSRNTGFGEDAVHERVPRNAPHVFNLGAKEFTEMFWDIRIEANADFPSGFKSPAGMDLPEGLESALAVQAMFPVTSSAEMAGQPGENAIADATADGDLAGRKGVWARLAKRLRKVPAYVDLFKAAYPAGTPGLPAGPGPVLRKKDITYVHAANAIAAYEDQTFRAIDSPFDRYLQGDSDALSLAAQRGMDLFYGYAGCAGCHSGPLMTDHQAHAIAMPQIGPGKGDAPDGLGDLGRGRETGEPADNYRFRTPSLRNVAITGPWGHDGAYDTLEAVVRHHLDPVAALYAYDATQALLPPAPEGATFGGEDFTHHETDSNLALIAAANELSPLVLTENEVDDLIAFLHTLTDPASLNLRQTAPMTVPSGLPVAD